MAAERPPRIDSASMIVHAFPRRVYQAHMDPHALVSWLPPEGMTTLENLAAFLEGEAGA